MKYTEQQIFEKYSDCVLKIVAYGSDGEYLSHGSAVVLKSEKMVITNFHNIMSADSFELYTEGGELVNYTGMVLNDPEKDILILSIDNKIAKNFSDIKYDYQGINKIGDKIVTISFQENYEKIISDGIIGGTNKEVKCDILKLGRLRKNLIIFTANISPGSSGGAVFNLKGELIGISTLTDNRGKNLNFAVPFKEINELIHETKDNPVFKKNTYKIKEYVYKIFKAIENENFCAAIENLNICLELEINELYFLKTKIDCLFFKGDFKEALENCNYGICKFPSKKKEFDVLKIGILLEQKNYTNAYSLVCPYILKDKTIIEDTDIIAAAAEIYLALGKYEEAYEILEKARIKNNDELVYIYLAQYYFESKKNIYKAVKILYEGLVLFPEEVQLFSNLYFYYYTYSTLTNSSNSKLIKALEFLNKALFLIETQDKIYIYRRYYMDLIYEKANLLYIMGECESSLDLINYYIEYYPESGRGYSLRGSIKYSQKKFEESLKDFDYALKINDKDENSYAGKFRIYLDLNDENEARFNIEKLIELHPVNIDLKVLIVFFYNKIKDYENALLYCKEILLQNEKHYSSLIIIANIYANTGKYEEAKKYYEIIYKYYPNDKNLYFCWGTFLVIFCELYEDAIKVLSIAINKFNDYYEAYLHRGIAQFELLKYELAIQDFNKAIEISPKSEDAYLCRGKAYYKSINKVKPNPEIVEMAIKDFNKTIEISPSYEDAYYFRGILFYSLGLYEKALLDWEYLIALNIHREEELIPLMNLALKGINPNIFRRIINFFKKTR